MNDRTFDRISRGLAMTTSRRQALKLLGGGIAGGALAASGVSGLSHVSAQVPTINNPIPIEGVLEGDAFSGFLEVTQFVIQQGQLAAVGNILNDALETIGSFTADVTPVVETASCTILDLVLGPINLDLLGLVITTNQIELNITAVPGGGLLGDLLCAVANLLSGNGNALGRLRNLLNQILGALGGA